MKNLIINKLKTVKMKEINKNVSMETSVNGFLFYRSYFEAIETLSNKKQLIAYRALAKYALNGEEEKDLPPNVLAILKIAMPNLDANRRKYLKKLKTNPKETLAVFEEGVSLPKKEKKPIIHSDVIKEFEDDESADEFDD